MSDDLVKRLTHRLERVQSAALAEAVSTADEAALARALQVARGWNRVTLVAALGNLREPGPADAQLADLAQSRGPGTQDLRCASLLALGKRQGSAGTDEYRKALRQPDGVLRSYALVCLAVYGDASAWDDVLAWFERAKPSPNDADKPTRHAVAYLLRHASHREGSRDELAAQFGVAGRCSRQTRWRVTCWRAGRRSAQGVRLNRAIRSDHCPLTRR